LGRVWATLYGELVIDRLYSGKIQLEKSFQQLVEMAAEVLDLVPAKRRRTILRFDANAGTDKHIGWALEQGYQIMTKVKNWKRVAKLTQAIEKWIGLEVKCLATGNPRVPGARHRWRGRARRGRLRCGGHRAG